MIESKTKAPKPTAQEIIMNLVMGASITHFIKIFVELDIPDTLYKEGQLSADEIAKKCGTLAELTYRFLRGLSVVGIVEEHEHRIFSLTPVGEWLRSDIPGSFKPMALMSGGLWSNETFPNLYHTLKTGVNAFKITYGCEMFEWLMKNPEQGKEFGQAMSTYSGMEIALVASTYNFSEAHCIVDIGGSHGDLLTAIFESGCPARGILFDTPATINDAKNKLAPQIAARIDLVPGDFFQSIPKGGDVYILKHILHDWDDEKALKILKNISSIMKKGAILLVIEQGITGPGIPGPGKMLDLSMMALTDGGKERTPQEHQSLFEKAGLKFLRTIPTNGPITIFEGMLFRID